MMKRSKTRQTLASGKLPSNKVLEALRKENDDIADLLDMVGAISTGRKATRRGNSERRTVPPSMVALAARPGPIKRAAIVVGHTKVAQGASAASPINQPEYPWNTDLAKKIKARCDSLGVPCEIFFRDVGGISGAYSRVSSWAASCVVELHFNAINGTVAGTMTLYDNDTNSGSKAWATRLQAGIVAALGRTGVTDMGLRELDSGDRGHQSCSALDIPSALIEPFFGDNPAEAALAQSRKNRLADAIAGAMKEQLGF